MIRLACALLSAVLFGLFSSTSAGATSQVEISTVTSYNYDNNEHAAATADTTSERGPPSTDDDNTGSDAVDLWSGGAWSHSETEAPAPTTTSVHPAHAAAATGTTERHVRVTSRESRALSGASVAAKTVPGYGVGATPKRVPGPWTISDLKQGAFGRPPRSLGRPDLHHADQMPGSGIHEVPAGMHRGNTSIHPNRYNQGVTDEMRMQDRQLHWWYRSQQMGGWDELGPSYYYDNWP